VNKGANARESEHAQSKADFCMKQDCDEILKILTAIVKTSKAN